MNRAEAFERARRHTAPWDVLVVGGGATGIGIAIDAASRGYETLLLEQSDFGKGASSRSTKLAHGGVRYLQQGQVGLVAESLRERGTLLANAPHLVSALGFVVPAYSWWEKPYYGLGLELYSLLAGRHRLGETRILSREETLARVPGVAREGLRGGVLYFDGQFDDARLLIDMAQTAYDQGAALLNYVRAAGLTKAPGGAVNGVIARDEETGEEWRAGARVVINATGAFGDELRRDADSSVAPSIAPSQGTHLVLDRAFLPGDTALIVPRTSDARVLFAIPWLGHTLVGTTDVPVARPSLEPVATEEEIGFILSNASRYLARAPRREDVLSVFAGIRPLERAGGETRTAALSRDHRIYVDGSRLVTITGGKWTTYRRMAEDCVDGAAEAAGLPKRACVTRNLRIHGYERGAAGTASRERSEAEPPLGVALHPALPYTGAEIVRAARYEMARTVEDALARRTRALFLNARAAMEMAPAAAGLMARELGRDAQWEAGQVAAFQRLALGYLPGGC